MDPHRKGKPDGMAGLQNGRPRLAARTCVDFALFLLFAFVAQVSAAYGGSTARADGLRMYPDALATAGTDESFALDMRPDAIQGRVPCVCFSQDWAATTGLFPALQDRFRLAAVQMSDRAAAISSPNLPVLTVRIEPRHAATVQFDGPFLARRAALVEAMLTAAPDEMTARHLDYAQFLIAQMMLPEARGVLAALPLPEADAAAQGDRAAGYSAILSRLGGGAGGSMPDAWADDPLWPVLVAGLPVPDTRLRAAFAALSGQSRAVATAALPLLFDVALGAGDAGMAAELLATAPTGTDLDGTSLLNLMRARLALAQGGDDLAFDTFARVSEGHDRAAAEARIALADMALARGDHSLLPQVSRLLQDGLPRWRGDATALRLRVRLARVAEDTGDIPTAVETMSMIRREHPATPEADLAEARIGVMIGRLADEIGADSMPLADAIATVRRLEPSLVGRGGWIAARTALADRLAQAGLAEAARAEYAVIAQSSPAALRDADPVVLDRVAVGHAALLLQSGRSATALAVLDRHSYPRDAENMAAHAALRLQAGQTAILPGLLLAALKVDAAHEIADPSVQLALGDVALTAGQDDAALAAFERGIGQADQTRILQASRIAGAAGDATRAARFADALQGDRGAVQRAVVDSLAAPRKSHERLSISGATALITAAGQAGASVDALLSGGTIP